MNEAEPKLSGKTDDLLFYDEAGTILTVGELGIQTPAGYDLVKRTQGTARGKGRKQTGRKHVTWGMIDQERLALLNVTSLQFRILNAVIARISADDNLARISQAQIARQLNSTRASVARSVADLKDRYLIFEDERGIWRVSLWLFYRGPVETWEKLTGSDPEPMWDRELESA